MLVGAMDGLEYKDGSNYQCNHLCKLDLFEFSVVDPSTFLRVSDEIMACVLFINSI